MNSFRFGPIYWGCWAVQLNVSLTSEELNKIDLLYYDISVREDILQNLSDRKAVKESVEEYIFPILNETIREYASISTHKGEIEPVFTTESEFVIGEWIVLFNFDDITEQHKKLFQDLPPKISKDEALRISATVIHDIESIISTNNSRRIMSLFYFAMYEEPTEHPLNAVTYGNYTATVTLPKSFIQYSGLKYVWDRRLISPQIIILLKGIEANLTEEENKTARTSTEEWFKTKLGSALLKTLDDLKFSENDIDSLTTMNEVANISMRTPESRAKWYWNKLYYDLTGNYYRGLDIVSVEVWNPKYTRLH